MEIRIDDLQGREVADLLEEHLQMMRRHSPPESKHALDLEALRASEVTFWSAWEDGELVGCAAWKVLDRKHVELKSMKTKAGHERKGVGRSILAHVLKAAKEAGYERVSLETGSMEYFKPARTLYERFGFHYCAPFSDYTDDPNSVFLTKDLKES